MMIRVENLEAESGRVQRMAIQTVYMLNGTGFTHHKRSQEQPHENEFVRSTSHNVAHFHQK